MVLPYPRVECKHCQSQIAFPTPNPQESEARLHSLAKGTWQIYFQCPHCGRVARYCIDDVHLTHEHKWDRGPGRRVPPPGPSGFYYRVEHRCGHNNCGLPHVLFLQRWRYATDTALARMVASLREPSTHCSAGHDFESTFDFVSAREVFWIP
jgi:hypothetical protein